MNILVYGATGHTGRFVVEELRRRGLSAILGGRDAAKLAALGGEIHVADLSDPASLARAVAGCAAVINCAGPFLDTAVPVARAAFAAGAHYLDITAEQASARATLDELGPAAAAAGVLAVPAAGFYGALGDLLATAAVADWPDADSIAIAVALDSWQPTAGTVATGRRNTVPRVLISAGRLAPLPDPPPRRSWSFPPPFDTQEVVAVTLTELVAIAHHLRVTDACSYMNTAPLAQLRDPATPPLAAGRSSQQFVVDVIARRGTSERRATASGRDIYAITAPLVVEALARILDGRAAHRAGAFTAGSLFDARDFLAALGAELAVAYDPARH